MEYLETFVQLMRDNPKALEEMKRKLEWDKSKIDAGLVLINKALFDNSELIKAANEIFLAGGCND